MAQRPPFSLKGGRCAVKEERDEGYLRREAEEAGAAAGAAGAKASVIG